MRIAVIGSHGTGKTTLSRLICEKLNFNFIPDVARQAHEKKFSINEKTPPETQFWILSKQLELERNTDAPWVSEKSLFDNLIYGGISIEDEEVLSVLEKLVFANAKYDLIFYLPIEFPLEDDGLRSLDPEFQKKVDREFRNLIKKKRIKVVEVKGSIKERAKKALKLIKSHKSFPKNHLRKK